MPDAPWYSIVNADLPITQGDLIFNCPILEWEVDKFDLEKENEIESLKGATNVYSTDVVVMTQACDLQQEKVSNIIICPHYSIRDYYLFWKNDMESKGQNPTEKSWRNHCDHICDGFIWNFSMLNKNDDGITVDIRFVDFHEVFTVPRSFLEALISKRGEQRLRLLPPYREHLSQSFARFFMRVGLPIGIAKNWVVQP
jgi:hypothetical protein